MIALCFTCIRLSAQSLNIYVSPSGASSGLGASSASPVSLTWAKSIAKSTTNKLKPINIWLMDGIYTYLSLDTTDSRTASAPVTYHSLNKLKAVFQPITSINSNNLQPIPDSIKNRIVDSVAKLKVKQLDLSSYNLSNMNAWPQVFGYPVNVTATTTTRQNWPIVYQNSTPLPMAQYPNGDSVMRMLTVLNNGSTATGGSGGIFKYRDDRCKYWQQAIKEGLWLRGNWRVDWQMDFVKTDSITLFDSTVYQSKAVTGGIGNKYTRPGGNGKEPYVAVNLVEEIDIPGEWAINFNTKKLYIYPPDSGSLKISSNSITPTISLDHVSNTNFEGFELDGGSGIGVKLNKCTNVSVLGFEIKNTASYGIMVADGNNCIIRSNDIHDVGEGGVYLINSNFNADQLNQISCNHKVINNHIYNYAKDVFLYAAAIDTRNVIGAYCAYNSIAGCKHVGILFGGNNNVFEYNDISSVVQTYTDMGAFYTSENQTKRGNKINWNYIHNMNYKGSALYADNDSQGSTFYGNIAANCLYGTQNNFGLFNKYLNNIYYDNYRDHCTYAIAMTDTVSTSSAYTRAKTPYLQSNIYKTAYPDLKDYFDTVNKSYTSAVWPQINGSVFIGTSIIAGRCISALVDNSLFLTNGNTNTKYARTGIPFTQYGLICDSNFLLKTSVFGIATNLLDSIKTTGAFKKTTNTNWHISRIGLFKDSIYRSTIAQTQTIGKAPKIGINIQSAHIFTYPDTLTFTITIKNPNMSKSYQKVLLYDSIKALDSLNLIVVKSSFDSVVLKGTYIKPAIGIHKIIAYVVDSTLWNFASDTSSFVMAGVLPIYLLNFTARNVNCATELTWNTINLNNIYKYDIERQVASGNFEVLQTVAPNNLDEAKQFKILLNQDNETANYRIHVIGAGFNYYSTTKTVINNCNKNCFSISPNPIAKENIASVKLSYMYMGLNKYTNLILLNTNGKIIAKERVALNKGHNIYRIPTNDLSAGIYFIQLENEEQKIKLSVF